MANKLFLISATLAFFFLLANASIYRTIVELDEDDATNPIGPQGPQRKCRREFQQAQHLRACQQWIRRQARQGGWPSLDDEDEFEFENRQGGQGQRPRVLQQCCQELHQEDPVCVCPTLRQAAQSVRIQGQQQHGPRQVQRIFQTAKNLPNVCNIPQVSVCPFQASPFSPYY